MWRRMDSCMCSTMSMPHLEGEKESDWGNVQLCSQKKTEGGDRIRWQKGMRSNYQKRSGDRKETGEEREKQLQHRLHQNYEFHSFSRMSLAMSSGLSKMIWCPESLTVVQEILLGVSLEHRSYAVCFSIQSLSPQQNYTLKGIFMVLRTLEVGLLVPAPGMKNSLQMLASLLGVSLLTLLKQSFHRSFSLSWSFSLPSTILSRKYPPRNTQFRTLEGVISHPMKVRAIPRNILLPKEPFCLICSNSLSFVSLSVNFVPMGEIRTSLSTLQGYLKEQLAAMQPPKECPAIVNFSISLIFLHSSMASTQQSTSSVLFISVVSFLLPDNPIPMRSRACTQYFCARGVNRRMYVRDEPPQP